MQNFTGCISPLITGGFTISKVVMRTSLSNGAMLIKLNKLHKLKLRLMKFNKCNKTWKKKIKFNFFLLYYLGTKKFMGKYKFVLQNKI